MADDKIGQRIFPLPRVVISRCIECDPVRYNGDMVSSETVKKLKKYVEFIPVCPEVEIGLGVPREPVRMVRMEDGDHLIQPSTGRDLSREMTRFAGIFLDSIGKVEGFIAKSRSPSSAFRDARVYPAAEKSAPIDTTPGFFGRAVLSRFPLVPVEDEGRLRNFRIRDHFLTRIFTLADFRLVEGKHSMQALVEFHTRNRLLLLAHGQRQLSELGHIVANQEGRATGEVIDAYREGLLVALSSPPRYTTNINALLHALGRVSAGLSAQEKALFLDAVERYHAGTTTICAPKTILRVWIARFEDHNLASQTFFSPYPDTMMEVGEAETERGRDFWA
ncbi:MAG: DUF523 and DUF1722 domain-containing protein [Methanomicrobiaceae archaeon]|nr:DUF523 and DUF1722 domain-containing protein [Methanomicrobiaceae archaeon]